ncbi:KAP family P-loop NTPase fold protein [Phenylobacterium sp. VNQ135]|uniref:KAP family P-loop NTPase fold protein n=1 Tax=Phenylobacterium sp. VNQ135 TaxID=3400922 RepID=UPI003C0A4650
MLGESFWRWLRGGVGGSSPSEIGGLGDKPVQVEGELQSERPLETADDDRLDRAPFARRVAGVLADRPAADSIVVGLFGPWGDGKTSALAMIKEALRPDPDVVVVEYNPWFFSGDAEAIAKSFFLTIGDALERSGLFSKEKIGGLLATYGGLIPKVGDAAKRVGEALSVRQLAQVRHDVGRILGKHKKRVVVFIDDIDRLDRKEIQTLFKLVRLSGDFPYTSYVLAFDDGVVADALSEVYGEGDTAAGRRFLEKIIQVPLHLPPANPETLQHMAFSACDRALNLSGIKLNEQRAAEFANQFAYSLMPALKTPRQVRLYDNALTFAVPILKGEVNVGDQMLIEGVRIFYPDLYAFIRDHPSRLLKATAEGRDRPQQGAILREALGVEVSDPEIERLQRLVEHLFPRTSSSSYGGDWEETWAGEKRICASGYFRRYFTYAIPAGDMADAAIDDLIAAAQAQDADRLGKLWAEAREKRATKLLISKLRLREGDLPTDAITGLTLLVAGRSEDIPRTREPMLGDHTFRQCAILLSHLLARAGADQSQLLDFIISSSPSIGFATEVLDWCAVRRTQQGERRGWLGEDDARPHYQSLWERIREEAESSSLLEVLGTDFVRVLIGIVHAGFGDEVKAEVRTFLEGDRDGLRADQLLAACTSQAYSMETGAPVPTDFQRHNYDAMALIADPEFLLDQLRERYGDRLETETFPYIDDFAEAERPLARAQQFAGIHRAVLAQSLEAAAGEHKDDA